MTKKIKKTRNAETWTEAKFWGSLRSILRRGFRYWKPISNTKVASRREYKGDNGRQKWEYLCNHCKQWFKGSEVQVDHIEAVGSLKCWEDLVPFVQRLTAEEGYQVLCKSCHKEKTKKEREERK